MTGKSKRIIRKITVWLTLLTIGIPNVVLGDLQFKFLGAISIILVIGWDTWASNKLKRRSHEEKQVFLKKYEEFMIYMILVLGSYVVYVVIGDNPGSFIMGPLGVFGLLILATRLFIKSIRHDERLARLEGSSSWRFAKSAYLGIALILFIVGAGAALVDVDKDSLTGYIAWLGLLLGLMYPLFRHIAYYVAFGKTESSQKRNSHHERHYAEQ